MFNERMIEFFDLEVVNKLSVSLIAQYINAGDYENAMYHHFINLFTGDEMDEIWNEFTEEEQDMYYDLVCAL